MFRIELERQLSVVELTTRPYNTVETSTFNAFSSTPQATRLSCIRPCPGIRAASSFLTVISRFSMTFLSVKIAAARLLFKRWVSRWCAGPPRAPREFGWVSGKNVFKEERHHVYLGSVEGIRRTKVRKFTGQKLSLCHRSWDTWRVLVARAAVQPSALLRSEYVSILPQILLLYKDKEYTNAQSWAWCSEVCLGQNNQSNVSGLVIGQSHVLIPAMIR